MHLYEINSEIDKAIETMMANVDPETGEVRQEDLDRLGELQIARDEKLDNIGAYIKNIASDIDALKNEEKALEARRKVKENELENLKAYVGMILNGEKFESSRVRFSFRKSKSVKVTDINLLPDDFIIGEISYKPDKAHIKEAIEAGQEVRGAYLEEKQNLQIK